MAYFFSQTFITYEIAVFLPILYSIKGIGYSNIRGLGHNVPNNLRRGGECSTLTRLPFYTSYRTPLGKGDFRAIGEYK